MIVLFIRVILIEVLRVQDCILLLLVELPLLRALLGPHFIRCLIRRHLGLTKPVHPTPLLLMQGRMKTTSGMIFLYCPCIS